MSSAQEGRSKLIELGYHQHVHVSYTSLRKPLFKAKTVLADNAYRVGQENAGANRKAACLTLILKHIKSNLNMKNTENSHLQLLLLKNTGTIGCC